MKKLILLFSILTLNAGDFTVTVNDSGEIITSKLYMSIGDSPFEVMELGTNRVFHLSNLKPGRYRYYVITQDDKGELSEPSETMTLLIPRGRPTIETALRTISDGPVLSMTNKVSTNGYLTITRPIDYVSIETTNRNWIVGSPPIPDNMPRLANTVIDPVRYRIDQTNIFSPPPLPNGKPLKYGEK